MLQLLYRFLVLADLTHPTEL